MSTLPKKAGIYKIHSLACKSKIYIGSSINIYVRNQDHLSRLIKRKHSNAILQKHFNKYGLNDLVFEVIELVSDNKNLISREQHYTDSLKPYFNICKVAGSTLGRPQSKETRLKRSISSKGRVMSPETKKLMSAAHVERYRTNETVINGFEILDHLNTPKRIIAICPYCSKTILYLYKVLINRTKKHCGCIKTAVRPIPLIPKAYYKTVNNLPTPKRSIKHANNTSGWAGVTYDKAAKKYRGQIKHKGKSIKTGSHNCPTLAIIARDKYIIENNLPHPTQIHCF